MNDAELLRAARRDPDAFCAFYERHAVRLRRWLRAGVDAPEVATDLAAETFAQALVSLHRFRGETDDAAAAWLYAIARNLLFQYRRRRRVETAARTRLAMPVRVWSELEEPDLDVRDALASLPARDRRVLELRVVDELPYDEIAERLQIAPAAARMRVHRALRLLGARLKGSAA